jgi:DNA repair protein RecN (Recombination protein N)
MLKSLHVHNFALLEDVKVEFAPGCNIFTGETGAGKSILVDAFSVVLGNRASAEYIRGGTDGFWVQAVFDVAGNTGVQKLLQEQDIALEDENLFLKRKLSANGKGQCSVNGMQVPLAFLRSLSRLLVDIHGQHENQALLEPEMPLILTDIAGGEGLAEVLEKYKVLYSAYMAGKANLEKLENSSKDREHLLEMYSWEIKEIEDAKLEPGEEERLQLENKRLLNHSRIMEGIKGAHASLDDEGGALETLAEAKEKVRDILRYDESLKPLAEALDTAWITADDVRQELADKQESDDGVEEKLNQVQERLDKLYKLHKKYGATDADISAYLQQTKAEYEALLDLDSHIAKAKKELARLTAQITAQAERLTLARKKQAELFCAAVVKHLRDLAMPQGKFTIDFQPLEEFGPTGADRCTFMFSANKGEGLLPLVKIVSGGELSRVALAIKTVLNNINGVPTMVFDEIDTGVGGVTAQSMAQKMAVIAQHAQVLCITHLPQIAVFADRHLYIYKDSSGDRTITHVKVLQGEELAEEIMRMSGGAHNSKAALGSAKELLASAQEFKANLTSLF